MHGTCRQSDELLQLREHQLSVERSRDDLSAELDSVRLRQADSLEFTNRMTSKNTQLQADNLRLSSEVSELLSDLS